MRLCECMWVSTEARRSVRSHGAGGTDRPPDMRAEILTLFIRIEQESLLTTEPSLQPLQTKFLMYSSSPTYCAKFAQKYYGMQMIKYACFLCLFLCIWHTTSLCLLKVSHMPWSLSSPPLLSPLLSFPLLSSPPSPMLLFCLSLCLSVFVSLTLCLSLSLSPFSVLCVCFYLFLTICSSTYNEIKCLTERTLN